MICVHGEMRREERKRGTKERVKEGLSFPDHMHGHTRTCVLIKCMNALPRLKIPKLNLAMRLSTISSRGEYILVYFIFVSQGVSLSLFVYTL